MVDVTVVVCADHAGSGHALLGALVALATGLDPADVRVTARCGMCDGPHGRPLVRTPQPTPFVSLARAGRWTLAVCAPAPVGVDVEGPGATEFDGFARVALTRREARRIAALPGDQQSVARTDAWVRKEALLKLHGVGLTVDPSTIDVGQDRVIVDPLAPPQLVGFTPVDVAPGYRAVVAMRSPTPPEVIAVDPRALAAGRAGRVR